MKRSASSTRKKVVIRKLDKELIKGFVDPSRYLTPEGVEALDSEGRLIGVPFQEIKGIFFVRDFDGNPQHPERKVFRSRPRQSGLWIRMTFRDTEVLEGTIPNNLLAFDPSGFLFTPLDVYSNNLKIYVPRGALASIEVLGVITDGTARRNTPRQLDGRPPGAGPPIDLFTPAGLPKGQPEIKKN